MKDIEQLKREVKQFTIDRDWEQFHDGKNLAVALSIEANELLEAYLWKNADEVNEDKVREELADVINYALLIADKYNLDVCEIVREKMKKNNEKYPVEKAKGTSKKYNEL